MEFVKRKRSSILARCEACGQETEIPFSNLVNPAQNSTDLKDVVRCACGEYHNLVVPAADNRQRIERPQRNENRSDEPIKCPKCGSTQLHAGAKGFSLGKAAVGGLALGPVGLLGGMLGSKRVMVTCLKCGHKWQAGKQR